MRLFIDECLSPQLAIRLNATGLYDATHLRDYGRLGEADHLVLRRCIDESRTIVTQNARDFRKLVGAEALHPGLVILPAVGLERSFALLESGLAAIRSQSAAFSMVNCVVEVSLEGNFTLALLPPI